MISQLFSQHFWQIQHRLQNGTRAELWLAGGVALFTLAFLIVGISRIVEFQGLGLSDFRKRTISILHILGCTVFSMSFFLLAVDFDKTYDKLVGGLLCSGLIILFPVHIYAGLLRRTELRRREPN